MGNKNVWLEKFEQADEQEKLDLIWELAHLETANSASRHALHIILRWLTDYTLEQVDVDEDEEYVDEDEEADDYE